MSSAPVFSANRDKACVAGVYRGGGGGGGKEYACRANRDKGLKSSVDIAKSGFRKLQFAPLNFAGITFKGIFFDSFKNSLAQLFTFYTFFSRWAKYSKLCVFLTDLDSDTWRGCDHRNFIEAFVYSQLIWYGRGENNNV